MVLGSVASQGVLARDVHRQNDDPSCWVRGSPAESHAVSCQAAAWAARRQPSQRQRLVAVEDPAGTWCGSSRRCGLALLALVLAVQAAYAVRMSLGEHNRRRSSAPGQSAWRGSWNTPGCSFAILRSMSREHRPLTPGLGSLGRHSRRSGHRYSPSGAPAALAVAFSAVGDDALVLSKASEAWAVRSWASFQFVVVAEAPSVAARDHHLLAL